MIVTKSVTSELFWQTSKNFAGTQFRDQSKRPQLLGQVKSNLRLLTQRCREAKPGTRCKWNAYGHVWTACGVVG